MDEIITRLGGEIKIIIIIITIVEIIIIKIDGK